MPGTAMHHMIAERIMGLINQNEVLGNLPAGDYQKIQTLFGDKKHLPYYYLGCQGPDFLFFHTPDWHGAAGELANFYVEVVETIEDIKKDLLALVPQPVLDALAAFSELGDEVVQSSSTLTELSQLFSDINTVLLGLKATIEEAAKKYITDWINPFDSLLSHPYRDGVPKNEPEDWWYFDALHYRKTGQYAKLLLDSTSALTSPNHLYALGYMSHVGADTVGHAYVNMNSGGPYRAQPQRHRVAENFQDVFNYALSASATQKDLNRSQLHAFYNFNFNGNVSPIGAEDTIPDPDTRMPNDLAQLIADSINKIYQVNEGGDNQADFGPPVTAQDIKTTYHLWYRWWRATTETSALPTPVPYSFSGELREVWETAADNLSDIGDFLENAADKAGSGNILSILAFLAALAIAAVAAALAIVDFVLGALTTLSVAAIRAAAALIYEQVYNAYQMFRLGVSLNGLAYPMMEHLPEPVLRQFTDPSQPDSRGLSAVQLESFLPLLRWTQAEAENFPEKHLIYPPVRRTPGTSVFHGEKRRNVSAPSSYLDKHSSFYGWGDLPMSPEVVDALAALQSTDPANVVDAQGNPSDHEKQTLAILNGGKNTLGNAVQFTGELYNRARTNRPLPDFNLDADRGYAYLCWTQPSDDDNTPERLVVQAEDNAPPADVVAALEAEIKLRYITP